MALVKFHSRSTLHTDSLALAADPYLYWVLFFLVESCLIIFFCLFSSFRRNILWSTRTDFQLQKTKQCCLRTNLPSNNRCLAWENQNFVAWDINFTILQLHVYLDGWMDDLPRGAFYANLVVVAYVEGRNVYMNTVLKSAKITFFWRLLSNDF